MIETLKRIEKIINSGAEIRIRRDVVELWDYDEGLKLMEFISLESFLKYMTSED